MEVGGCCCCLAGRGGLAGGSGSRWESGSVIPSRALKAGSTLPPLAVRTALTTLASMVGNASFRVFSACCRGLKGRGGLAGGASSLGGGLGKVDGSVLERVVGVTVPVSWSLSKSNGRAVVGLSGGPSLDFSLWCKGETGEDCWGGQYSRPHESQPGSLTAPWFAMMRNGGESAVMCINGVGLFPQEWMVNSKMGLDVEEAVQVTLGSGIVETKLGSASQEPQRSWQ